WMPADDPHDLQLPGPGLLREAGLRGADLRRRLPARPPQPAAEEASRGMMFAIKADVRNPRSATFAFRAQKTMYGGRKVARGDTIFVFASENEGGPGLVANGVVTSARAIPKRSGVARQTPRVSITVRRAASARRPLGRRELRPFAAWGDGRPET